MRLVDADNLRFSKGANMNGILYVPFCEISKAPTVDAQPVAHGRWIESVIERTMGALNGYKCSVCGHEKIGRTCLYNYCPECGAKMDEVGE